MMIMEKTTTLNLRVNPSVKQQAEAVLRQLGISMSTAIDIYLRQISLTGSIPFSIALPNVPDSVNADIMTDEQLREALLQGIDDLESGNVREASAVFAEFRSTH
jgi:addiction module RelB/DinJ family antitoxin